ncbi:hypothetical protein P0D73_46010 [Paraburkholderia sp. RL18-101-BIB-B]|uniref:hypothetical protein n=1 Tax=Paraburkholderia sp. RL18-101-BIB-B TaxID=3031634 RepID=UPI0038B7A473
MAKFVYTNTRMGKKRFRTRRQVSCPIIGAFLCYRARIVRVIAEARGQRAMIESLDATNAGHSSARSRRAARANPASSYSELGLRRGPSDGQPSFHN